MLLLIAGLLSFALPLSCYFYVGNLKLGIERVNSACVIFVGLIFPPLVLSGLFLHRFAAFQKLTHSNLWILASAALVCVEVYLLCWNGMMMGLGEVKAIIRINLTSSGVFLVAVAMTEWRHRIDLSTTFLCYFFYRALATSLFLAYCHQHALLRLRSEWGLVWKMFSFGARAQLGNLCTMGFLRTIFYYLYRFRGALNLGVFGVAYGLSEKYGFLTNAVQFVCTRSIVGTGLREAKERTWRIVRAMLLVYAALILPLYVAAKAGIPLFYGPKFNGAVGAFLVLSIGAFLNSANQIVGVYINGRLGRPELNSMIAVFSLLFAASVGRWAVERWGLVGAAGVISATYLLQFTAALLLFGRVGESAQAKKADEVVTFGISNG